MKHKIVFLNGPPRSGKDTAGMALLRHYESRVRLYEMKRPIDNALRGFFNVDATTWQGWEKYKDEPGTVVFNGHSLRQVKIDFSEQWAKRLFGAAIFGECAVRHLTVSTSASATVITDSGFRDEAEPLIEHFGIANCLLVHIHRNGRTFDGDSRSYWEIPELTTLDLYNQFDLDLYEQQVIRAVGKWLGF